MTHHASAHQEGLLCRGTTSRAVREAINWRSTAGLEPSAPDRTRWFHVSAYTSLKGPTTSINAEPPHAELRTQEVGSPLSLEASTAVLKATA